MISVTSRYFLSNHSDAQNQNRSKQKRKKEKGISLFVVAAFHTISNSICFPGIHRRFPNVSCWETAARVLLAPSFQALSLCVLHARPPSFPGVCSSPVLRGEINLRNSARLSWETTTAEGLQVDMKYCARACVSVCVYVSFCVLHTLFSLHITIKLLSLNKNLIFRLFISDRRSTCSLFKLISILI